MRGSFNNDQKAVNTRLDVVVTVVEVVAEVVVEVVVETVVELTAEVVTIEVAEMVVAEEIEVLMGSHPKSINTLRKDKSVN